MNELYCRTMVLQDTINHEYDICLRITFKNLAIAAVHMFECNLGHICAGK